MDQDPTTPTTEHERGVPSWPRFRFLYALWSNCMDWETRGHLARMVVTRKGRRILAQLRAARAGARDA